MQRPPGWEPGPLGTTLDTAIPKNKEPRAPHPSGWAAGDPEKGLCTAGARNHPKYLEHAGEEGGRGPSQSRCHLAAPSAPGTRHGNTEPSSGEGRARPTASRASEGKWGWVWPSVGSWKEPTGPRTGGWPFQMTWPAPTQSRDPVLLSAEVHSRALGLAERPNRLRGTGARSGCGGKRRPGWVAGGPRRTEQLAWIQQGRQQVKDTAAQQPQSAPL